MADLTIGSISAYWPGVLLTLQSLMAWALWSLRTRFASKADIAALEHRLTIVEASLDHLPTKDDMHATRLELARTLTEIAEVRSDYRGLTGLVDRLESTVTRHEQVMIDGARRFDR